MIKEDDAYCKKTEPIFNSKVKSKYVKVEMIYNTWMFTLTH